MLGSQAFMLHFTFIFLTYFLGSFFEVVNSCGTVLSVMSS